MYYIRFYDIIQEKGGKIMPSILTHALFAEDVYQQVTSNKIVEMIKKNQSLFYMGSSGPDFLFFYHALPWESYKDHTLNKLGSMVHASHVDDFYEEAIRCIQQQKHKEIQERMFVYLLGHLCHWALDKTAHPYIYYRTGNCKGQSASYHHRLEAMIDTKMLAMKKQCSVKEFPTYDIVKTDREILQAIARIYVPVAKKVFDTQLKVSQIKESLQSWYDVLKLFHDPKDQKYKFLKFWEERLHRKWKFSGYIIRSHEGNELDIFNESHQVWKHPCDDTLQFTTSFLDLYEIAQEEVLEVIEKVYACVYENRSFDDVRALLKNASYNSGKSDSYESDMQYFDIIFE